MKIEFWDKKTPLTAPDGSVLTPADVFRQFPVGEGDDVVLEYLPHDESRVGAIDNLAILRGNYGILEDVPNEDALLKIREIRSAAPPETADDFLPITRAEAAALEVHLTEVELLVMEAKNG